PAQVSSRWKTNGTTSIGWWNGAQLKLDFHPFSGKDDIGEMLLALLFDPQQELVIMVRVVVGEGQPLDPRPLGHLDRLLPAAVAPAFLVSQLFRRILGIVNEEISADRKLDDVLINAITVLDIGAEDKDLVSNLNSVRIGPTGMIVF